MKTFFLFLSVLTSLLGVTYFYSGFRLVEGLAIRGTAVWFVWIGLALAVLLVPMSYLLSKLSKREKLQTFFAYLGLTNFGFFTILFSFVLLMDLVSILPFGFISDYANQLFLILVRFGFPLDGVSEIKAFSLAFTSIFLSTGFSSLGFINAHVRLTTKRVSVKVKNLHPDLDGFTIVQISDVHIGPTIKGKFLERVVRRINLQNPDLVAITGDLVDGPVSVLKQYLKPLEGIQSKFGTFYVTGNHEYYSGVLEWLPEIRSLGISVLLNQNQKLNVNSATLLVAGVTDLHAGRILRSHETNPKAALETKDSSDFKLLLAHQPNSILDAERYGVDLQLSGHTHGGQYFPGNLLIYLFQRFVAGLHTYKTSKLYVSRGTGYWGPPIRLGAPSEISVIELERE
ncbi:MAG: metallophosphoesterase [Leptospira sp.]|nr:metallophosphoesterase [Leptospira sp.]